MRSVYMSRQDPAVEREQNEQQIAREHVDTCSQSPKGEEL